MGNTSIHGYILSHTTVHLDSQKECLNYENTTSALLSQQLSAQEEICPGQEKTLQQKGLRNGDSYSH